MVAIIDYGLGNLGSIKNMLNKLLIDSIITNDTNRIFESTKLILPGVGNYDFGMSMLETLNLKNVLHEKVIVNKTPILGICLGAQLMLKKSEEGSSNGLNWISGEVVKFNHSNSRDNLKTPHMGWNTINPNLQHELLKNLGLSPRYYFVHSFHFKLDNDSEILSTTEYGYEFCSAFVKENIIGVQFHPEKSHKYGLKLLENFCLRINA